MSIEDSVAFYAGVISANVWWAAGNSGIAVAWLVWTALAYAAAKRRAALAQGDKR